jgi:mono/diheme cytochrome c family protein
MLALAQARADDKEVARGKYLVSVIGCSDCHTPGAMTGSPKMDHFLAGSDIAFGIPGMGAFVPPNLTSDQTGLGNWTKEQIVTAITTGKRPDGRMLAPVMPWEDFAHLTKVDATAIAAYLKSLPPVRNKVAGPFGPKDKVPMLVETIVPGGGMAPPPAGK